ncbi:putative protein (beta protein domain) [Campylobacter iguaniorum]|uniref:beta family protein n=1 Tax=Campylobacter iguaniorum TaxID=1244531 RepID=UPI00073A3ACB|nr:hypothetical protein [Campylobacter iguaniorum]ALV24569.1 putative protein (beta protein domain) [Campylobacter iguaniorum]
MYYPIIKNELNEIKAVKEVNSSLSYTPIIELVSSKTDDLDNFFNSLFDSTKQNSICSILKDQEVYIDIPSYLENEIINNFNLKSGSEKYNFFEKLNEIAIEKEYKQIVPVISFDYFYDTQRKSNKENIEFFKKITNKFNKFAIRIYSNNIFKNNDNLLLWQLYDFMPDIMNNAIFIMDIDNSTIDYAKDTIKEINSEFDINKIIFAGEVLKNTPRIKTDFSYDRLSNKHLDNFNILKKSLDSLNLDIEYADFTLTDKIPSKIDIDPDKGFLYYPFIKYTTEDGKICMFSAGEKGKYEQYLDLCKNIIKEIRTFDILHCKACDFINDVANGNKNNFKAGATWKYRMIAHHITSMSHIFSK